MRQESAFQEIIRTPRLLFADGLFLLGMRPPAYRKGREWIRVTVSGGGIVFKDYNCFQSRFSALKSLTLSAFNRRELPRGNYRFWINAGDEYRRGDLERYYHFAAGKPQYPCFSFWNWPEAGLDFERTAREIAEAGLKTPETRKVFLDRRA